MVEGKNEEMSTTELSGGARIHYIFQNIFVKSLEVRTLITSDVFLEWSYGYLCDIFCFLSDLYIYIATI